MGRSPTKRSSACGSSEDPARRSRRQESKPITFLGEDMFKPGGILDKIHSKSGEQERRQREEKQRKVAAEAAAASKQAEMLLAREERNRKERDLSAERHARSAERHARDYDRKRKSRSRSAGRDSKRRNGEVTTSNGFKLKPAEKTPNIFGSETERDQTRITKSVILRPAAAVQKSATEVAPPKSSIVERWHKAFDESGRNSSCNSTRASATERDPRSDDMPVNRGRDDSRRSLDTKTSSKTGSRGGSGGDFEALMAGFSARKKSRSRERKKPSRSRSPNRRGRDSIPDKSVDAKSCARSGRDTDFEAMMAGYGSRKKSHSRERKKSRSRSAKRRKSDPHKSRDRNSDSGKKRRSSRSRSRSRPRGRSRSRSRSRNRRRSRNRKSAERDRKNLLVGKQSEKNSDTKSSDQKSSDKVNRLSDSSDIEARLGEARVNLVREKVAQRIQDKDPNNPSSDFRRRSRSRSRSRHRSRSKPKNGGDKRVEEKRKSSITPRVRAGSTPRIHRAPAWGSFLPAVAKVQAARKKIEEMEAVDAAKAAGERVRDASRSSPAPTSAPLNSTPASVSAPAVSQSKTEVAPISSPTIRPAGQSAWGSASPVDGNDDRRRDRHRSNHDSKYRRDSINKDRRGGQREHHITGMKLDLPMIDESGQYVGRLDRPAGLYENKQDCRLSFISMMHLEEKIVEEDIDTEETRPVNFTLSGLLDLFTSPRGPFVDPHGRGSSFSSARAASSRFDRIHGHYLGVGLRNTLGTSDGMRGASHFHSIYACDVDKAKRDKDKKHKSARHSRFSDPNADRDPLGVTRISFMPNCRAWLFGQSDKRSVMLDRIGAELALARLYFSRDGRDRFNGYTAEMFPPPCNPFQWVEAPEHRGTRAGISKCVDVVRARNGHKISPKVSFHSLIKDAYTTFETVRPISSFLYIILDRDATGLADLLTLPSREKLAHDPGRPPPLLQVVLITPGPDGHFPDFTAQEIQAHLEAMDRVAVCANPGRKGQSFNASTAQSFFKVAYEDLWEELIGLHSYICKKHQIGFEDVNVDEWHFLHPEGVPQEAPDDLLLDLPMPSTENTEGTTEPEQTIGQANSKSDVDSNIATVTEDSASKADDSKDDDSKVADSSDKSSKQVEEKDATDKDGVEDADFQDALEESIPAEVSEAQPHEASKDESTEKEAEPAEDGAQFHDVEEAD